MPHKRLRSDQEARDSAHWARRTPVTLLEQSPESVLLSLEGLRGLLLALPRAWLRQALCRLRSIVRELEVLVAPITDRDNGFSTDFPLA